MGSPTVLRGDRVTLHPLDEEDYEFCRDLASDPEVRQGISVAWPLSAEDHREFREGNDAVSYVIRAADQPPAEGDDADAPGPRVGILDLIHLSQTFGNAEIGYFLDPDHWGNGYASAAVACGLEYAFQERRLHRVYARVFAFNEASARVLEKAGFEREGLSREQVFVDGEYVDVIRYGLLEDEWRDG